MENAHKHRGSLRQVGERSQKSWCQTLGGLQSASHMQNLIKNLQAVDKGLHDYARLNSDDDPSPPILLLPGLVHTQLLSRVLMAH